MENTPAAVDQWQSELAEMTLAQLDKQLEHAHNQLMATDEIALAWAVAEAKVRLKDASILKGK